MLVRITDDMRRSGPGARQMDRHELVTEPVQISRTSRLIPLVVENRAVGEVLVTGEHRPEVHPRWPSRPGRQSLRESRMDVVEVVLETLFVAGHRAMLRVDRARQRRRGSRSVALGGHSHRTARTGA